MMKQKPGQYNRLHLDQDEDEDNEDLDEYEDNEDLDEEDEDDDKANDCRREAEKFSAQLKSFLRYEKSVW